MGSEMCIRDSPEPAMVLPALDAALQELQAADRDALRADTGCKGEQQHAGDAAERNQQSCHVSGQQVLNRRIGAQCDIAFPGRGWRRKETVTTCRNAIRPVFPGDTGAPPAFVRGTFQRCDAKLQLCDRTPPAPFCLSYDYVHCDRSKSAPAVILLRRSLESTMSHQSGALSPSQGVQSV